VQDRSGCEWRVSMARKMTQWGCHGERTLNAKLERLLQGSEARRMPRFTLTNQVDRHDPSIPVPLGILAEVRIASLGHTVLLNPLSSFQGSVLRLRVSNRSVFFVQPEDVIKDDPCESCVSTNEPAVTKHYAVLCGAPDSTWQLWGKLMRQRQARQTVERTAKWARIDRDRDCSTRHKAAAAKAEARAAALLADEARTATLLMELLNVTSSPGAQTSLLAVSAARGKIAERKANSIIAQRQSSACDLVA
jgi:hypothetical protein